MAINVAGAASGIGQEVETNTRAGRITHRPIDVGALGSYSVSVKSGVMAAGLTAGAPILAFRWAPATTTQIALIKTIKFTVQGLGTGFAAGLTVFDFFVARAFSAADTGGGAVTLTTNNGKLRTSFGTTAATIQASTTATLTAGTRSLDSNPFRTIMNDVGTATFAQVQPEIAVLDKKPGDWPLTLASQEGFVLQATVPATGTWTWACMIDWDEISSFGAATLA